MKKTITLARLAGFCYGVKRAVETTKKIKQDNPGKPVYVLGELIHNSDVIKELDALGIVTVDELPQGTTDKERGVCIIRSHGLAQKEIDDIAQNGYEVVDLTCPDVKKVQQKASELAQEGFMVVIVGKSEHPEVMAISANARQFSDKVFVVSSPEEIDDELAAKIKAEKTVGVVSQTTQRIQNLQDIVAKLTALSRDLRVFNTICASTSLRQNCATDLARVSDLMVVVGSKKSANTTHLAEILKNITNTIHIENEREIDSYRDMITNCENIGVTAGASTPLCVINAVMDKLKCY